MSRPALYPEGMTAKQLNKVANRVGGMDCLVDMLEQITRAKPVSPMCSLAQCLRQRDSLYDFFAEMSEFLQPSSGYYLYLEDPDETKDLAEYDNEKDESEYYLAPLTDRESPGSPKPPAPIYIADEGEIIHLVYGFCAEVQSGEGYTFPFRKNKNTGYSLIKMETYQWHIH